MISHLIDYLGFYSDTESYRHFHSLAYDRDFKKIKYHSYIGVCLCPKCGEKGYMKRRSFENVRTGWRKIQLYVDHHHKENGKTIHDKTCSLGYFSIQ